MIPSLLDTDSLSEVIKRRNSLVVQNARNYIAGYQRFTFSAITRYEIQRGYLRRQATTQLQRFDLLCQHSTVLPITTEILDLAAPLWAEAQKQGLPNNDADLIIAATALFHDLTLVTGNTAHFGWIDGLRVDDWRTARSP